MKVPYGFVLLGVILLYFQLILGRVCRYSRNWFALKGAEVAYTLPNLCSTIAMLLMPEEPSTAVWILHLIALNNSMAAYDGEDGLMLLWTLCNIMIFCYRAVISVSHIGLHGAAFYVARIFVVASVCATAYCKVSIILASTSKRHSEEIADYMIQEYADASPRWRHGGRRRQGRHHNAFNLQGYRYVVNWEPRTTVEQIYEWAGVDLEASNPERQDDEMWRRADLCLSFALFRLLFRRYHGFHCAEARRPETLALVVGGLLSQQADAGEYRRGFGVFEVELGFLHDHIHGGYVLWSRAHRVWYYVHAALKALVLYIGSWALYIATAQGPPVRASDPVVALLLLHGFFDLLQVMFYYKSDRWMVSFMCRACADQPQQQNNAFREKIALMHKLKLAFWNQYWQNKLGQYCVLTRSRGSLFPQLRPTLFPQRQQTTISHSERESAPVRLPAGLKASIAWVLRESRGILDGVPLLRQPQDLAPWETTGDMRSRRIKVVLKWHIATWYCDSKLQVQRTVVESPAYRVAMALSRYCAYLVAFRPELLPCPEGDIILVFRQVLDEVTSLGDLLSLESKVELLERARLDTQENMVVLSHGVDLGHVLLHRIQANNLWTILANIWSKLILSFAPQQANDATYAKRHVKYLAQGGEFVTHLWAMLSAAGILEQVEWPRDDQVQDQTGFISELEQMYTAAP